MTTLSPILDASFSVAAGVVWRQFLNLHHAIHDVDTLDSAEDSPELASGWRNAVSREYRGGLDVLSMVGHHAGLDTTEPNPSDPSSRFFSLPQTERVLLEWAKATNQKFPANLRDNPADLRI